MVRDIAWELRFAFSPFKNSTSEMKVPWKYRSPEIYLNVRLRMYNLEVITSAYKWLLLFSSSQLNELNDISHSTRINELKT